MHDGMKLISAPSKTNICLLICSVMSNSFSNEIETSYYLIENKQGKKFFIYARDDMDFYRKFRQKCWLESSNPSIPARLEENNNRQ